MVSISKITLVASLLAAAGCAGVASTTRTGSIHDVKFEQHMTPANLQVEAGDEVRWVNQRTTPVTVEFLAGALDAVSCESGFSDRGFKNLRGKLQESATIAPNESVSLCFANLGTVTYNARMDSDVAGGQVIEAGTVRVGL
jgi:plastocyanin